jgi:hypothetical protein
MKTMLAGMGPSQDAVTGWMLDLHGCSGRYAADLRHRVARAGLEAVEVRSRAGIDERMDDSYQMVLHRPVEPAGDFGKFNLESCQYPRSVKLLSFGRSSLIALSVLLPYGKLWL